jgi:membrane protein DedA with SNARE-associated domain
VQHFISSYGYLVILLLMTAEAACIPVPSEFTMPLGGAVAAGAVALLPVVRAFISPPASYARMRPVRFGAYTAAGSVARIGGLAWAGYAVGPVPIGGSEQRRTS